MMRGGFRPPLTESEILVGLRLVGKGTSEQIGKAIVRGQKVCLEMLREMEARGAVHICGWLPTPGEVPPIYTLGPGECAPKPSRSESFRLWAELNPEAYKRQQERRSKSMKRAIRISKEVRAMDALAKDQRPALERWACPDLSRLPRSIFLPSEAIG